MSRSLVLFARAPERGRVKTRLAATLGEARALALYEAFLGDCAEVAGEAARRVGARLVIAVAGPMDHPLLVELAEATSAELVAQREGDLGVKMGALVEHCRGEVCLIGSDAPTLRAAQITRGFEALATHEVVIGPGIDGGYWLLGTRRSIPELFLDMPWSTEHLLQATLARLAGRSALLLDFFYDVDEGADLVLLERHLGILPDEVAPRTRRALAGS